MYYLTQYPSQIGLLTLACDECGENLTGLWIEGQKYHGHSIFKDMSEKNEIPLFKTAKMWLERYFAGENPRISELPLAPAGGEFRLLVWQILREIPYGEVITYRDIAQKTAAKMKRPSMSSQAVGGAVGHNPISIIVPCHRVVGSNGSLTGFASGVQTKIKLLEHEGVDMTHLFVPVKGTAL